jgi:hypothetical protein
VSYDDGSVYSSEIVTDSTTTAEQSYDSGSPTFEAKDIIVVGSSAAKAYIKYISPYFINDSSTATLINLARNITSRYMLNRDVIAVHNHISLESASAEPAAVAVGVVGGIISKTTTAQAITNKVLSSNIKLTSAITLDDAKTLAQLGITTFSHTIRNGTVIGYSVNTIGIDDIYGNVKNSRVINRLVKWLSAAYDYVELNYKAVDIYMAKDVTKQVLDNAKDNSIISDYSIRAYTYSTDPTSIYVEITAVPYGETYQVSTTLEVT